MGYEERMMIREILETVNEIKEMMIGDIENEEKAERIRPKEPK